MSGKSIKYMLCLALILCLGMPLQSSRVQAANAPEALNPELAAAVRTQLALPEDFVLTVDDTGLLKSLYAYQNPNIRSLKGMENAKRLKVLVLDGNPLERLDPIQELTELTFLSLIGTETNNVALLRNLTSMQKLLLSNNQIQTIEALTGMGQLTDLLLNHNEVTDLTPLKQKPITWLDVSFNQVESIAALKELPKLQTVFLNDNRIEDLTALLDLPSLRTVSVYNNPLNDISSSVIDQLRTKGVQVLTEKEALQSPTLPPIQVVLDRQPVEFSKVPELVQDTTMVQFRPLFEKFGLEISWDQATGTVTGKKGTMIIELVIGSTTARMNGKEITLPVAPYLSDGNTMIPLRFIGEATGRKVAWNGSNRTVTISSSITSYNLDIVYSSDTQYAGEMKNSKSHGKGKLTYKGILFYEGEFNEGEIEGTGKMYDPNNGASYYEGEFRNNRFHGEGKIVYDDGAYHVGSFVDGMRTGSAKVYKKDGALAFEGMFENDARNGQGMGVYGDFKYIGLYANDAFNGYGKMYYKGKLSFEGEWKDEEKVRGKTYVDGLLSYDGTYEADSPHGTGTFYIAGKPVYYGEVKHSKATGLGKILYANGDYYIGEAYNRKADGVGILKDKDGTLKHSGHFKEDQPDLNPEATAKEAGYQIKLLKRNATHQVIDGMSKNNLGLKPTQAVMFIKLESEDHLEQFGKLSDNSKMELIHSYVQEHWGDVIGVEECFVWIIYGKNGYALSSVKYNMPITEMKVRLYDEGTPVVQ